MNKLVLLVFAMTAVNAWFNVRPKPLRRMFQRYTFESMNLIEKKLIGINEKIRKVWDTMGDNLKLAEVTLKKIQAMEEYAHQLQEEFDPGELDEIVR